jgi:hypothetical protein
MAMPSLRSHDPLGFKTRLAVYLGLWTLCALALQPFFMTRGFTPLAQFQRQAEAFLLTPVIVVGGLACAPSSPNFDQSNAMVVIASLVLGAHAVASLYFANRTLLLILFSLQAVLLSTGAIFFIRFLHVWQRM